MLVTVNPVGFDQEPKEVSQEVESLVDHFSSVEQLAVIKKRSRAFQELLKEYKPPRGFEVEFQAPISKSILNETRANYRVDLSLSNLNKSTLIPVELAFNNRESIGTNLLKLEAFMGNYSEEVSTPFGIIITPTSSLLNFGGWDSSYGDNLEYEDLRARVYGKALTLPIYLVELHGFF